MLKDHQDAYGHEFVDYLNGITGPEIVERDDGYIEVSVDNKFYFADYKDWTPHERKAIRYARGRVLDVGCGAGRCLLYLQQKGLDVMGIDVSPLAVKVCKIRGIKNVRVLSITRVSSKLGFFDTILMFGGSFGLFGCPERAKWQLKRFHKITSERGRIIALTCDPYRAVSQESKQYRKFNKKRGRMPGQFRFRIRYKKYVTPWIDWLVVSKKEMTGVLKGTGWQIKKFFDADKSPVYIAIIEKER
jgi:SAM-dependent methyltransferase